MPKSLNAIAKLLRMRRIPFLGLTGTGLDDFDGRMLAAALEETPPSDAGSSEPERLDLTQIDFEPNIRPNPGPPPSSGRKGRRVRAVEQARRPGAAPVLNALKAMNHYTDCATVSV